MLIGLGWNLVQACGTPVLQGLRLQNDEIVRLQNIDMKNLLRHKKLCLVLDLDHTLLNSTLLIHMTPEEEYLKTQTDSLQGIFIKPFLWLCFGSVNYHFSNYWFQMSFLE